MSTQAPRYIPPMGWGGTLVSFGAPAVVLLVTTRVAIPSVTQALGLPPIVWFMTFGAFYVLGPLAVIALLRLRGESLEDVAIWRERLRFRPLGVEDWRVIGASVAGAIVACAGIGALLTALGVSDLVPSFLANSGEQALAPRALATAWIIFGTLSVLAQEVLWRGVYLPRQQAALGDRAWVANAAGWTLFHAALGWKLLLVLSPILILVPFVAQKRGSSLAGATSHALTVGAIVAAMAVLRP